MSIMHNNNSCLRAKIFLIAVMACLGSRGENYFLHETTASFWETNLVATVIGFTKERAFMGTTVPEMNPSEPSASQVWFYSIAPTNFARLVFSMHKCGPGNFASFYPTNQLFVFPASFRGNSKFRDPIILREGYNSPKASQTIHDYCPACTLDKLFPITDSQSQYWEPFIRSNMEVWEKRFADWRDKLKYESDEKKRASLSNRVEIAERKVKSYQREIEDCKHQSQYFKERIDWLKTQGVNPEPQKTFDE